MARPARRSPKILVMNVGMVVLAFLVVGVPVSMVVGFVKCQRFESELTSLAERHLTADRAIDVAAIASARTTLRDAVEARGAGIEKVRMGLLRREDAPGTFVHVIAIDVAVESCHVEYRRELDRRLSVEELAVLAQLGVRECGACVEGRRHEHEP
jgi:hypothetical protein